MERSRTAPTHPAPDRLRTAHVAGQGERETALCACGAFLWRLAGSSLCFHLSGGGRRNGSRRGRRRQSMAHVARRQTGAFGGPREGGADSGGEGLRPVTCERHSAGRLKTNEGRRAEARAEPERI